jgi:hypothetical protein
MKQNWKLFLIVIVVVGIILYLFGGFRENMDASTATTNTDKPLVGYSVGTLTTIADTKKPPTFSPPPGFTIPDDTSSTLPQPPPPVPDPLATTASTMTPKASDFSKSFYPKQNSSKDSSGNTNPNLKNKAPIYGPLGGGIDPDAASRIHTSTTGGDYPQIYGPDVVSTPGTNTIGSGSSGKGTTSGLVSSDQVDQPTYEFNPDLKNAFPYDGPPQPFLTNFKKIQH